MSPPSTFFAWALPTGIEPPSGPGLSVEVSGVDVRYPVADPPWVGRLCAALREAREGLASYEATALARILGRVGRRFSDRSDPYRAEALALLPPLAGVSPEMGEAVLDGMAADWTEDRLLALLQIELGRPELLDRFGPTRPGPAVSRLRAIGPRLALQVVSGSVPGVSATAMIRSLLVKGPTLIKPGLGDVVLPVLFARALAEEAAAVADAVAVVYWPGGSDALEDAALHRADTVVAYGSDETVRSLRARAPATVRFQGYHHRVGLGVVGRGGLRQGVAMEVAVDVATAVAMFEQRGCVSPHVIYVEEGGDVDAAGFARRLAAALAELEQRLPGGHLDASEASAVHQARGVAEMMASTGAGVEVFHGGEAFWTVILDPAPAFAPGCVGRVVRVKPVADIQEVPGMIAAFGSHLQSVGVAGCGPRVEPLADALADAGVSRIVPFSRMPFPPAWWHHDGQGALRCLLRWSELEQV